MVQASNLGHVSLQCLVVQKKILTDIEEHRRIRELVAREIKPEFVQLIEGGHFMPTYAQIVSMTPQEVLDKSQQQQ